MKVVKDSCPYLNMTEQIVSKWKEVRKGAEKAEENGKPYIDKWTDT